jgi:tetratricopeptide (TPR) repeat protein
MYGIGTMGAIAAAAGAIVLLTAAPVARAQESDAEDTASAPVQALRLYRESQDEYRAGRFGHAADRLEEAYRIHPDPNLLYNLARAHEGEGNLEAAIAAYERFIAEADDVSDSAAIDRRIDTLRYQLAEREALTEEHDHAIVAARNAELRARRAEASDTSPLPWVFIGAGAATVVSGALLGAVALERHDAAATSQTDTATAHAEATALGNAAIVSLVAGAALLTLGTTWLLLDDPSPSSPAVRVTLSPGVLTLSGRL